MCNCKYRFDVNWKFFFSFGDFKLITKSHHWWNYNKANPLDFISLRYETLDSCIGGCRPGDIINHQMNKLLSTQAICSSVFIFRPIQFFRTLWEWLLQGHIYENLSKVPNQHLQCCQCWIVHTMSSKISRKQGSNKMR